MLQPSAHDGLASPTHSKTEPVHLTLERSTILRGHGHNHGATVTVMGPQLRSWGLDHGASITGRQSRGFGHNHGDSITGLQSWSRGLGRGALVMGFPGPQESGSRLHAVTAVLAISLARCHLKPPTPDHLPLSSTPRSRASVLDSVHCRCRWGHVRGVPTGSYPSPPIASCLGAPAAAAANGETERSGCSSWPPGLVGDPAQVSPAPRVRRCWPRPAGAPPTHWWMACRNLRWCFLTLAWSIFFSSFVCL